MSTVYRCQSGIKSLLHDHEVEPEAVDVLDDEGSVPGTSQDDDDD
ncbi:hypothetical protein ACFQ1S_15220 [Kibdelosporangium lantanae]|uniref:Uncharacterized protein n=1 Tax=Kibdelosporangium lantanae TaxID=1497396 RepID=A0ABW3M892_9PSEU